MSCAAFRDTLHLSETNPIPPRRTQTPLGWLSRRKTEADLGRKGAAVLGCTSWLPLEQKRPTKPFVVVVSPVESSGWTGSYKK